MWVGMGRLRGRGKVDPRKYRLITKHMINCNTFAVFVDLTVVASPILASIEFAKEVVNHSYCEYTLSRRCYASVPPFSTLYE